jgi:ribose transport system permease protein
MSVSEARPATARRDFSLRQRIVHLLAIPELGVIGALGLAIVLFFSLEPAFLSSRNIHAMLNMVSFVGIIAVGQTILLVNGEFDLSVGSVAGLGAVVAAKLMTAAGWSVPAALCGGVAVGGLVGLLNGIVVVHLRIPAFIQTLGMLFIGQGVIQIVTGGYPVYPLPDSVASLGSTPIFAGLSCSFFFFLAAAFVGDFLLRRTIIGRNMYATGGNALVAKLVGINTTLYRIAAFILVGALSAIAGIFVMADLASGSTSIGSGWELSVIAGVVVGGVSLFGGSGTIVGGLIGILLLQVVQSGLVIVGIGANWQQIAVGTIMILAVGLDTLRRHLSSTGVSG